MTSSAPSGALDALIDPDTPLEKLADGFWFTEGAAWSAKRNELIFSDIPRDVRWRWTEKDGLERVISPNFKGNGTVFEEDGSLLVCEQVTSCVTRFKPDGGHEVVAFQYEGKYLNSPNDIVVKSDGSIWFTDPNYGRWDGPFGLGRECDLDFQGVYRMERDGSDLTLVVEKTEFQQPNGLCFSPDESILYVNDSPAGELKAFEVRPDRTLGPARLIHSGIDRRETREGTADGMKCDEHGNVWCTGPYGVWVISPAGELLGIYRVREIVGNLVWGGDDLKTLFLNASDTLYSVRTNVRAGWLPSHR
ncbi:SMP-30/gluconolactonase/LRE family protein [Conexibacter sp. CPCC 206217]|uniref:SMP-30/gluconolactonase/LRE family protein n=1 Tax=Conexibacter sp. CPCC 206217 TaxID=3064574 RepID=UPI00272177F2|nr:SMP-30/gluconolactonase/LRE family protein [Conexibacter sp. CPCC 206217]MDO8211168.1 SMP-30/gluconolactonase/LRE family protein [Conexibacter sp. CPCC 206217]